MNPPSHRQPDEAAAQARGAFAARLIEHLAVAAFVIDRDGRVVVWNRACERLTGVPAGTTTTVVNGTATAIAPPLSSMADVTGTVSVTSVAGSSTVSTALTTANVRALQALTGGPTIEVANRPVDGTSGAYTLRLPVAAPVKAAYAASAPLSFAADTAVAGKYTIQAQSPDRTPLDQPVTVTSGTPTTANFTFIP